MLHTEGLRHHVNICQHFYKWCDCHCWLHWSFHRNIRKILFSHPTVWVKLKQGVSLRRLRTPPPSNGPMKPFGRQQCLEWNYVWGEPKGHCCLGQTDTSAGKSCYWRGSPFTRDWEIKTKALSFHGRRGRGDRVRTVLKERYPGLVHTSWESCQPQMLSASELVSFVSGSPQRPAGVRWLL